MMAPAKTPKTAKPKSAARKNTPVKDAPKSAAGKDARKASETKKPAAGARKPAEAGRKTAKSGASSGKSGAAGAKYKNAAKRRPGRRKTAKRGSLALFIRAFALVLVLGGGLLYALAPRGLDLLNLAVTDSAVDLGAPEAQNNAAANVPAATAPAAHGQAANGSAAYSSGQEPPVTPLAEIMAAPGPETDTPPPSGAAFVLSPLEDSIVRIDEILRRAMEQEGLSRGSPRLVDVQPSVTGETAFLFQVLNFSAYGDKAEQEAAVGRVMAELADTLPKMRPPAAIAVTAPGRWTIAVEGVATHELIYQPLDSESAEAAAPAGPSVAPGRPGRLLIVIDDIGADLSAARALTSLNFPVTLAVWPRAAHAKASAEAAHAAGREVMIHQPMEPVSYPRDKPGPGAVFTSMSDAEIRATVAANLKLVPYAVGLNNHMGSKATQDRRVITDVLAAMQGKDLFVLDSITHDHSLFYSLARAKGFAALKRDIFLDNVQDARSITHQLNAAARLSVKQGWAIAIGHPYPQTIAALRAWQNSRPANVRIVTAKELLGKD